LAHFFEHFTEGVRTTLVPPLRRPDRVNFVQRTLIHGEVVLVGCLRCPGIRSPPLILLHRSYFFFPRVLGGLPIGLYAFEAVPPLSVSRSDTPAKTMFRRSFPSFAFRMGHWDYLGRLSQRFFFRSPFNFSPLGFSRFRGRLRSFLKPPDLRLSIFSSPPNRGWKYIRAVLYASFCGPGVVNKVVPVTGPH